MLPGTTPTDPDDRGDADPALVAALAAGERAQIATALVKARLLVPVVAMPADTGDAEMAVPALVRDDGRRALPAFSSYSSLRAWQPDARPVPMSGSRVIVAAADEGYDAVVLDVAGPLMQVVEGHDLTTLATLIRDHGVH